MLKAVLIGLSLLVGANTAALAQANIPQVEEPESGMNAWESHDYGKSYLRIKPPSPETAARYFRRAAAMGNIWAAYDLAELLRKGDGIAKNPEEAARIYRSVEAEIPWAKFQLGEMLRDGAGIRKDTAEARRLLEEANKSIDNEWVKVGLASLLAASGQADDLQRASSLLAHAAGENNTYAQERLAELCVTKAGRGLPACTRPSAPVDTQVVTELKPGSCRDWLLWMCL